MNSTHSLHWLVSISILLMVMMCEINSAQGLTTTNFNSISQHAKVLRVDSYLTAFVWKEHATNVQQQYDIFDLFTSPSNTSMNGNNSNLKIAIFGMRNSTLKQLWTDIKLYKNISESRVEEFETIKLGSCRFFNIFEEFDIIISEPYEFYTKLKGSRLITRKRLSNSDDFLESSDFVPFPLFPISVILQNNITNTINGSIENIVEWLNASNVCSEENYLTKYHAIGQYETQWLNAFYNFGKIRQQDLEFLSFVNNLKIETFTIIEMEYYFTKIKQQLPIYSNNLNNLNNLNSTISLNLYLTNLLKSNCTYCTNEYCTQLTFVASDYWIIPVSVLIIIYYLILFSTRSFQLPSIKRRLITPYTPIVCVFFESQEMYAMDSYCDKVRLMVLGAVMNWVVFICIFTVIRFYYLRNLYHTMALQTKSSSVKFNNIRKVLGSVWFGIVFTGLISFIVSLFVSLPHLVQLFLVYHSDDFDEFAVNNMLVALYILIGCIIGVITVITDMILNWKKIKQRGLRHFLIFDDPFMFRVDLVLFIVIIMLIIVASTVNQVHVALLFRFLIYFTFTFVAGGVVMMKSMIEKFTSSKKGKDNESDFLKYLKNHEFQELIKSYCLKEMSSENFAIYMDLMKIEKEGENSLIDLETLQNLEKDYFLSDSMYEVNIPHAAKVKFYQLLNSAKKNELPPVADLIETLLTDVLKNLYDTFTRLERTKEFKVWLEIYEIQLKNLLL